MAKLIMVVDDSASMRRVVGIALKGAGYDVLEGVDGKDALSKLTGQKVHMIISDVNMPVMDGIAFLKAVKAMPAYKFTPVIMLTTESAEEKKREGQAAGARAWVVKPFQPEQLVNAVQRLCLP
ncbi:MAG: response regulator [Rhodoferax sp.]|jgi:two-component system chemotaxis response regulator CheY|uniref:response regulator n=1 Tax=Rhodoferax sp. TaxID=50421 RepID=UPI001B61CBA9|nr:response regulator [Rhodoferax sp.]MBP8286584.1 response regulator [Rhodoferax sp.]MBP9148270.1 response regulator [Rhodoferax sp.]MBP9736094.1 response regulator [Rhodoferax sp.]